MQLQEAIDLLSSLRRDAGIFKRDRHVAALSLAIDSLEVQALVGPARASDPATSTGLLRRSFVLGPSVLACWRPSMLAAWVLRCRRVSGLTSTPSGARLGSGSANSRLLGSSRWLA